MACKLFHGVGATALLLLVLALHAENSLASTEAAATSESVSAVAVEMPTDSMEPPDGVCPGLGMFYVFSKGF
jgi:hypothetical protein